MTLARLRPANRRAIETVAMHHENQWFNVGLGRELLCVSPALLGPVVEVFVNADKVDTPVDTLVSDAAILMSLLIQYGHPIGEIARSMKRNPDGTPASILGRAAAEIVNASTKRED
jgi:hypothetical protein